VKQAIVKLAVDSRQTLQRYHRPCVAAINAEDVVGSATPQSFAF